MTAVAPETLLPGIMLYPGDCLEVLKTFEPNSVDATVTDAPYGLGREPDADETLKMLGAWLEGGHYNVRSKSGFMGKEWDAFVPQPAIWKEVYRVLKPGGYVLCFFGTRTYDLGVLAMRLAGFEVRDLVAWLYGSGFPKSLNIAKAIESGGGRPEDIRRMQMGDSYEPSGRGRANYDHGAGSAMDAGAAQWSPSNDVSREWEGWGTALKPAFEPIVLARKPLSESTVAANVLRWRTGALNIDACRVPGSEDTARPQGKDIRGGNWSGDGGRSELTTGGGTGRWPANVVHDGSDEVVGAFPSAPGQLARAATGADRRKNQNVYGAMTRGSNGSEPRVDESKSAARFFYSAKADDEDRLGSGHPTVKPVDLMRYCARLVTPPGGLVLDPFAGTGTTGEACLREGLRCILIEQEAEYQEDIRRRMKLALAGKEERARAIAKEKQKGKPVDLGPLFAPE